MMKKASPALIGFLCALVLPLGGSAQTVLPDPTAPPNPPVPPTAEAMRTQGAAISGVRRLIRDVQSNAIRGQPLYTAIIFYGEARDNGGLANVNYDVTIHRPDGSIYDKRDSVIGLQGLAPTSDREMQLGRNYLTIVIGEDDPVGVYSVDVVVHDKVNRVDLPLKQTFVVK